MIDGFLTAFIGYVFYAIGKRRGRKLGSVETIHSLKSSGYLDMEEGSE